MTADVTPTIPTILVSEFAVNSPNMPPRSSGLAVIGANVSARNAKKAWTVRFAWLCPSYQRLSYLYEVAHCINRSATTIENEQNWREITQMSAYVAQLKRYVAEQAAPKTTARSLRERFLDWHRGLPGFSRDRAFAMSEIEAALGTQGKYISPVLQELGWNRRRIWSTAGPYHRYWEPPTTAD